MFYPNLNKPSTIFTKLPQVTLGVSYHIICRNFTFKYPGFYSIYPQGKFLVLSVYAIIYLYDKSLIYVDFKKKSINELEI